MADPIDDLALRWKRNPDAPTTLALCEALRVAPRPTLVQQVGEFATQKHGTDANVLVAVARMYLEAQKLSDAQAALVAAGKIAPRDGGIYRWLGEVLLRRGDAERAEKVLERSLQLGADDPETRLWLDRARVFKPVQAKAGARAVAAEVAQAVPQPLPMRPKLDSLGDDSTTHVRVVPDMSEEGTTEVRAAKPPPSFYPSAAGDDEPTKLRPAQAVPQTAPLPQRLPPPAAPRVVVPAPRPAVDAQTVPVPTPMGQIRSALDAALAKTAPADGVSDFARTLKDKKTPGLPGLDAPLPAFAPPPSSRTGSQRPLPPLIDEPSIVVEDVPGALSAKDVLNALSLAGIFEAPGSAPAPLIWSKPTSRIRGKGSFVLVFFMLLLVGGGFGTYRWVREKRDKEHAQAEAILAKVEADMHQSRASLLPAIEQGIGQAFDFDSRSPRAALDWLRERALVGLVKSGADIAFEDAINRAKEVGVKDEDVAFARLASFLFQGDTAGAAALLPKWDGPAANDVWYQLIAGATLERAGDSHAGARYEAAAKLDPELVVAQIAQVKQEAIDGDPSKAADMAKAFHTKYPDRIEGTALVALAWGHDPERGDQPPPEVADVIAHTADLPLSLQAVPHALLAMAAIDKHALGDAKAEVEKGLAVANDPGMASWLGNIALDTGDEALGRKGALVAVGFSAVYPPARTLAARVALQGDRLDEALKATEELEAASPQVAVVRAAASYERIDADGVARALEAVPEATRQQPFLNAVLLSYEVLLGRAPMAPRKILDMSDDEAPWSDIVSMDLALDMGLLDVADRIAATWKGTDTQPLRALRLGRLARYENRLDDADRLTKTALDGTVTTRTLKERVMVLVARNKASEVGPLLGKYPLVLGPNAVWLSAYASASAGKVAEASGRIATVDPPPALAPFPAKVMAAIALGATNDRRRGVDYITPMMGKGMQDPDLVAAALALGFRRVPPPRR